MNIEDPKVIADSILQADTCLEARIAQLGKLVGPVVEVLQRLDGATITITVRLPEKPKGE